MTRRTHLTLVAAALAAGPQLNAKETDTMRDLLETSQKEKKGVMLYVRGQSVPGVVTKIEGDTVELRSREYSRIAVKLDAIDAVALS
jgi:hypothetical protein